MNEPWRVFLPSCTKVCGHYECSGTQLINEKNLSSYRNKVNEQVQCRDANLIEAINLSGGRMLFASSCGYPGAIASTNLSW